MMLSAKVQIRDAIAQDLQRIHEIERLAFPVPWSLRSFERELTLPFSRITVAILNSLSADGSADGLVGFLCRWLVADECHILNVAVHPGFRRRGVATRLMNAAIREAKAKRATVVSLEVRRSNLAARKLYREFQFEERRLRRHYYGPGEDAIVMELKMVSEGD